MLSFEEAFEQTGYGRFNILVVLMSGLALMFTNIETLGVGYIIATAHCELGMSNFEEAMINAAGFIGVVITAMGWGYVSDRFGRKKVMLPAIIIACVISLASSFSVNFAMMFILRFLTGSLVSASSATVYAYVGEMHSNSHRPMAIALASVFISFTFIALPILAWVIMPRTWQVTLGQLTMNSWRFFMWTWCTSGIGAAIVLIFLPESPRFLYTTQGPQAAVPVLAKIYAWNYRKKPADFPVTELAPAPISGNLTGLKKIVHDFWLMIKPPLRRCVIITHMSMFMVFLLSSGLYTWMPVILNEVLFNVNLPVDICYILENNEHKKGAIEIDSSAGCKEKKLHHLLYPISILMGILCAVTYTSIGFLMRRFNKIYVYCAILGTCTTLIMVSMLIHQLWVAIFMLIFGLSSGCVAAALAAISVDVFPTNVRALALCTLYMGGRGGAAVGSALLGIYLEYQCTPVILAHTLVTIASLLMWLLWPNTMKVRAEMQSRGFHY